MNVLHYEIFQIYDFWKISKNWLQEICRRRAPLTVKWWRLGRFECWSVLLGSAELCWAVCGENRPSTASSALYHGLYCTALTSIVYCTVHCIAQCSVLSHRPVQAVLQLLLLAASLPASFLTATPPPLLHTLHYTTTGHTLNTTPHYTTRHSILPHIQHYHILNTTTYRTLPHYQH